MASILDTTTLKIIPFDIGINSIDKSIGERKGDIIVFSAPSAPARLPSGSDGNVLTADSANPYGMKWATVSGGGGSSSGSSYVIGIMLGG